MAGTADSGNETLFSDGSSCDLVSSPPLGGGLDVEPDQDPLDGDTSGLRDLMTAERVDVVPGGLPPKIQPYSGVLEKGKIVIRPIAFKPVGMTPAARFGVAGERYGSTPILTRPGSHLVHYGSSNDLRHQHHLHHHHHHHAANSNYSLDRKLLSSSSPPLAMASLTSLPHKLVNYDSMESVRKSPGSTVDSNTFTLSSSNKSSSYRLSGPGGGSLLDLTPSPSDSGVSELEAALRDRDSELAYLRQTMEHNEQVIFRVYQEKEKVWERELRRIKGVHEGRLRASAQKALRLEQMLMMQTYQLQQDKKRLCAEAQRASCQADRLREEVATLRTRLEDTEWNLCQKTGEMALLKTQLKDAQTEQTSKGHELLTLRSSLRSAHESLERRDSETAALRRAADERDAELERLRAEMCRLLDNEQASNIREQNNQQQIEELKRELTEAREELSEQAMSEYEGAETGRSIRARRQPSPSPDNSPPSLPPNLNTNLPNHLDHLSDHLDPASSEEDAEIQLLNGSHHCPELDRLHAEMASRRKSFEQERITWAQEKEKVLRYQRQLQLNYVQMFRRTRALEAEVESLTLELEMNSKTLKKQLSIDMSQTVEL